MARPTKEQQAAKKAAEEAAAQAAAAQAGEPKEKEGEALQEGESPAGSPAAGEDAPSLLPKVKQKEEKPQGEQPPAQQQPPQVVEESYIESKGCRSFFEDGQIVLQLSDGKQKIAGRALEAARRLCPELLCDD